MSEFQEQLPHSATRRDVLRGSIAMATFCILGCDSVDAQKQHNRALRRPSMIQTLNRDLSISRVDMIGLTHTWLIPERKADIQLSWLSPVTPLPRNTFRTLQPCWPRQGSSALRQTSSGSRRNR